jgi:hypothetical protein
MALTFGAYGQNPATGGELTPDITWHIDAETLFISGKGVVPTTLLNTVSPWNASRSLFHSVVIEEGITDVGMYVFNGFKNLTSLTIGSSVKSLRPVSFSYCRLALVEVKSAIPPEINAVAFYATKLNKAKLIVPAGAKAAYEADPFWKNFGAIEESALVANDQDEAKAWTEAKTMAEPCVIRLIRTTNFVGGGRKLIVFLNGVEQGKLKNGSTVVMQTDREKNAIELRLGKNSVAYKRFDAIPGGDVSVTFSYWFGRMMLEKELEPEPAK